MAPDSAVLQDVQRFYAAAEADVDFARLLADLGTNSEEALAELIEADGRQRIAQGRPVDLGRYISSVADLARREDALDAAIDVALRSRSGSSRLSREAVEQMIAEHPQLEAAIREAARLHEALWSTTGLRASVAAPPPKQLPCEFGPILPSGQYRYQLQRLLGQGGFGQVYLALDRQLSEEGHTALVAIKILVSSDRSPWARQRLIEEATKARRISHPNVVMVMDRGVSEENEDFIVYEYVDGGDLSRLISDRPRLPLREAARLVAQVALGVHAAHSAGVIHCDLKPGNIMLTSGGEPKIADFGIAVRLNEGRGEEQRGGPVGNVAFISPEQYRGEDGAFSIPSDIYALGGILYLLLTNRLPNGETLEEVARTHDAVNGKRAAPRPSEHRPEIDRDLEAICRRAMAVRAEDRYSSAAMLADDLERWLAHEAIAWTRPGAWRVLRLWARRKPALAAAVTLIALLALSGLYFANLANRHALQAAINQVKAEQEEALRQQEERERQRSRQIAERFSKSFKETMGNYRLSTETLTTIWALEYIYGPKVLGLPDEQAHLWSSRVANIRSLVQKAHEEGRESDLETLLWESALGYWLVCDKNHEEAEPLLQRNYERWSRILGEHDLWLAHLRSMLDCCTVNRWLARASVPDTAEMRAMEAKLSGACASFAPDHRGTPIHFMLLQSLIDLQAEHLLNDEETRAQWQAEYETLVHRRGRG